MRNCPLVIGLALLSGCASPGFRYHTLQPAAEHSAVSAPHDQVRLTTVQIPAEADTDQLVVRTSNNTLSRETTDRWAAPLIDEIRGALDDAWQRDEGLEDVQNTGDGSRSIPQVGVQVQKLDAALGGNVELVATWWVSVGENATMKTWSCRRVIVEPAQGGIDGVVDAEQRVFRTLASDMAASVRVIRNQQIPICPQQKE